MQKTPKLGQDVHYHDHAGRTFAAKVTKVHGAYSVNLVAFDDGEGGLGGGEVHYQAVTWATTYGYPNAFSFPEASPEELAELAAPKNAARAMTYRETVAAPAPAVSTPAPEVITTTAAPSISEIIGTTVPPETK